MNSKKFWCGCDGGTSHCGNPNCLGYASPELKEKKAVYCCNHCGYGGINGDVCPECGHTMVEVKTSKK